MARVLIVYASQEGQTRRIAEALAETLRHDSHEVRLAAGVPFPSIGGADGVIVAASVHRGRHPGALARAIRAHATVLRHIPSAFLSVCLSAACDQPRQRAEAAGYLRNFTGRTGWRPELEASVAGALRSDAGGPFRLRRQRALARRHGLPADPPVDREYTDWEDVRRFAEAFSALLAARAHGRHSWNASIARRS